MQAISPNNNNNTVINPDQIKDTKALDFSNRKLIHSSEKYKFNIKSKSHFETKTNVPPPYPHS